MKCTTFLVLAFLHSTHALCALKKCETFWETAKTNVGCRNFCHSCLLPIDWYSSLYAMQATITGACAMLFDDNCCDIKDKYLIIPKGGKGQSQSFRYLQPWTLVINWQVTCAALWAGSTLCPPATLLSTSAMMLRAWWWCLVSGCDPQHCVCDSHI